MKEPPEIAVEEDGDEVFTPMPTHCIRWECRNTYEWNMALSHYPKRIQLPPAPPFRNERGFMECSRCGCSYGRG
jgi:hypothetical protein